MPSRELVVSVAALREVVTARIADTSLRQAAREIGIAHQTLHAFVQGTQPYGKNWGKLVEWYGRDTNEVLRLRQEITELRKELADCKRKLRAEG